MAIVGATVHDPSGAHPVPGATAVVRDYGIAAVGRRARSYPPDGTTVIDEGWAFPKGPFTLKAKVGQGFRGNKHPALEPIAFTAQEGP